MLFTASRLRRCCFPSKEAETGEQARAIQYPATYGWGSFESREKRFHTSICLHDLFYPIIPPEVQNKLEDLKELSSCEPHYLPPERCSQAWAAVQGYLIHASD